MRGRSLISRRHAVLGGLCLCCAPALSRSAEERGALETTEIAPGIHTRRGAGNDHAFRHRAPLFLAQVDPQRPCVRRATEQVLFPETGVDLGNFGVVDVSPHETWVVTSKMALSESRRDEPNRVLLARVVWRR